MAEVLQRRLLEPRRFMQVLAGPRQVGKTTIVTQIAGTLDMPVHMASADEPTLRDAAWLRQQWEAARVLAGRERAVLVIDEVQKVEGWPETVKLQWDEDTRARRALRVVLLGSAPLLIQSGLTESLAGRFEVIHVPHWSYAEMRQTFGWSLEQFVYFGGYPGAAPLIDDEERWRRYVLDALVETTLSRDVMLLTRIDKPALLRRVFELGCAYSGQILSYTKMVGQLQDAGNTTTIAHYLDLLAAAGMVTGLQKYAGEAVRRRASSPKLQVFNNALMSVMGEYTFEEAQTNRTYWGRLVESAIGSHLVNDATTARRELYYWRDGQREVDFIVKTRRGLTAIEVKSGRVRDVQAGAAAFEQQFGRQRLLLVGGDGVGIESFLGSPVDAHL